MERTAERGVSSTLINSFGLETAGQPAARRVRYEKSGSLVRIELQIEEERCAGLNFRESGCY
ncbi:MAG TPA: hypothetical protein VFY39_03540 [Gammaproteobacteria bacterium]|nr:hypothetical protein [Gammaproteobacteria bacterium]